MRIRPKCTIEGCENPNRAHGFCNKHLARVQRRGDPFYTRRRVPYWIDKYGYKRVRVNGIYVKEHRHIMEQHLGRKLGVAEKVHHKDGNKLNNAIENLEVISQSEHAKMHMTGVTRAAVNRSATHRRCGRCKEVKTLEHFYKSPNYNNGYLLRCRACVYAMNHQNA